MENIKKAVNVLIVVFIIIAGSGCAELSSIFESDVSIKNEMLTHLDNKYNKEFVATVLERGYVDYLHCYPKGEDMFADRLQVERMVRGDEKTYRDTYFGNIIREDVEKEVYEMLEELKLPTKVYMTFDSIFFDNKFNNTKTYEDLKEWYGIDDVCSFAYKIAVYIGKRDDVESAGQQVLDTLEKKGFHGLMLVCTVTDIDVYNEISRTNLDDIMTDYKSAIYTYSKHFSSKGN